MVIYNKSPEKQIAWRFAQQCSQCGPDLTRLLRSSSLSWPHEGPPTLRSAVLRRIVSFQVLNNLLGAVRRDLCAKGFVHFVYLGFPGCGRKWWLHHDVTRAVAGVAVNLNLLETLSVGKVYYRHRV